MAEQSGRVVGGTERSWCRAVNGGTGTAVVAILLSKPLDITHLQESLSKLQNVHPILRSRLHFDASTNTFSFLTSLSPFVEVKAFDSSITQNIIESSSRSSHSLSPLHLIHEHELNQTFWPNSPSGISMFFASVYSLPSAGEWVVVFRLHVAACDRTTAVSLLRELLVLMSGEDGEVAENEKGNKGQISLAIEDLIPNGLARKSLWERGKDMLGYSVNSFRLRNLKFNDSKTARSSQVVRLRVNEADTTRILAVCERLGIKLSSVLVAVGLMAAHKNSKNGSSVQRKYGVVTLVDCRSILHPSLSSNHFGFYHSAIFNTYTINGGESIWELAKKVYAIFETSKNAGKHFSDMADLNFLMCKAIENPGLTPSSSLRTSYMSVFEDTVVDESKNGVVGLEDYIGCASVHGVGPSLAIFDTVRDGGLDCVCVYPTPLHSREQMMDLVDRMKALLLDSCEK